MALVFRVFPRDRNSGACFYTPVEVLNFLENAIFPFLGDLDDDEIVYKTKRQIHDALQELTDKDNDALDEELVYKIQSIVRLASAYVCMKYHRYIADVFPENFHFFRTDI